MIDSIQYKVIYLYIFIIYGIFKQFFVNGVICFNLSFDFEKLRLEVRFLRFLLFGMFMSVEFFGKGKSRRIVVVRVWEWLEQLIVKGYEGNMI